MAVPSAVTLVYAAGTYSITAYNSPFCSTSSTIFETVSGSNNSTCVNFPGGRSLNLILDGTCNLMRAFFGSNCVANVGPSPDWILQSPGSVGCDTFALNFGEPESFNSFQIFC